MDYTHLTNPPSDFPGLKSISMERSKPLGYDQIADLSSAVGLTVPVGATYALIQAEGQSVRWRDDGTNPAPGVGQKIPADQGDLLYDGDLNAIRFIEDAASASLNVTFYANA